MLRAGKDKKIIIGWASKIKRRVIEKNRRTYWKKCWPDSDKPFKSRTCRGIKLNRRKIEIKHLIKTTITDK